MKVLYVIFGMAIMVGVAKVMSIFTDSDFTTTLMFVVAGELLCHEVNDKRHKGKLIKTEEEEGGDE